MINKLRCCLGLFFCLFFSSLAWAQDIEGVVYDQDNSETLSYVNIGIVGKSVGTVSDINGKFDLTIPKEFANDTLRFSFVGYEPQDFLVKDFVERFVLDGAKVYLTPKSFELDEVVVVPKDWVDKILGNTTKAQNFTAGFKDNLLGYEIGVLMKNKKKPTFIEEVNVNIANCDYDSIFFRLNVYELKKRKQPGENVLKEPIYISLAKEDIQETIVIDLRDKDILVNGDFVVTFELVKDLGEGGLNFSTGLFNSPTYYRKTSQDVWKTVGAFGIGFSTKVKREK